MSTRVITGKVRVSSSHIFEPQSPFGSNPMYSLSFLIPKNDGKTIALLKTAINEATKTGISKWNGRTPSKLILPLRDGDEERPGDPNYANSYFITCYSIEQPAIVNRKREPITDPTSIYPSCYIRVSLRFLPYNTNDRYGVIALLDSVQFWCDADPFNNRIDVEDELLSFL